MAVAQRAGAGGAVGDDGRSGSRDGSGRTSGGGAGVGVSTGSTVMVRDGPSSEPRGRCSRGSRGVLRRNFMMTTSEWGPTGERVPDGRFLEASRCSALLSNWYARRGPTILIVFLHYVEDRLSGRSDAVFMPSKTPSPRSLIALLAATAVLGGAAGAGIVAIAGTGNGTNSTTTVKQPVASTGDGATSSSASGLNAAALYAASAPGVVDITSRGVSGASNSQSPFGFGPSQPSTTATGTGFVVDRKGHIVTAAHVVDGASSITVTFQDGTTRTAKLLGKDDATDVAVLSVNPSGLTLHPLGLGSSSGLEIGNAVAAIGDPFTYQRSLSTGVVSGLDRTISAPNGFTVAHAIQTDAALNPGNSGGPVLDASGKVVGIVDQIATNGSSDTSSGVGFAVPIDLVKGELSQLEGGNTVQHAYLGVSTSSATTSTAGALIQSVTSGGPADDAGIQSGDVITALGSAQIKGTNDLVGAIATHKPGEKVDVTIRRGAQTKHVTVTLGSQPTQAATAG
jgi:putative serine protease PepD